MAGSRHRIRGGGGRFSPKPTKSGFFRDSLTPGLAAYGAYVVESVWAAMREWGRDSVDYMQAEASWTDRTGDARRGLGFAVDEHPVRPTVYLFHGVHYGVYLELRWGGDYAIILPTIEARGHELIELIEERI